jgi:hypothetical protein
MVFLNTVSRVIFNQYKQSLTEAWHFDIRQHSGSEIDNRYFTQLCLLV